MADTVSTTVIENGARNLVLKFTNVSDATGETNVVKVAAATYGLSITHTKVRRIIYNVTGGGVRIAWDATADVDMAYLSGYGDMNLNDTQGMIQQGAAGATGDILFSTSGFRATAANIPASGYTITLEIVKGV